MSVILCVAAHPDDEVLGCGGTLARHVTAGDYVSVLILGEGVTSRFTHTKTGNETSERPEKEIAAKQEMVATAQKRLGYQRLFHFDLPDQRFDRLDKLDIIQIVEKEVQELQPEIVYTHWEDDLNADHRLTAHATLVACRPYSSSVRSIYAMPILSSTNWGKNIFVPNVFIDISGEPFYKKVHALRAYGSELREYPHPRSLLGVSNYAEVWGSFYGRKQIEPFVLLREVV